MTMFDLNALDKWMEGREMRAIVEVDEGDFHIVVLEYDRFGGEIIDVRGRDVDKVMAQLALEQAAYDKKDGGR